MIPAYIYGFRRHEDEEELCALEQRRLFGVSGRSGRLITNIVASPDRSPFVKYRLTVRFAADTVQQLADAVTGVTLDNGGTFKVVYLKEGAPLAYEEQRAAERAIGAVVTGAADMRQPAQLFGITRLDDGGWVFGDLEENGATWLKHNDKPRHYSTALNVRMARAAANIAVPKPRGIRAVDPCCGIGTVLIEALSMGIEMAGFDINPLAVRGARENLAHFGYPDVVRVADIRSLDGHYDAAVLDLPYNHCSVLPDDTLREMLSALRRIADGAVLISTEDRAEREALRAGFAVIDSCTAYKGTFARHIWILA